MKTKETIKIGKYKITEDENHLSVRYRYTFSDLIGSIFYLISFMLGSFFLYALHIRFNIHSFSSWFELIISIGLILYGAFFVYGGLYNPINGVFEFDKKREIIIIRDLFKTEKYEKKLVQSFSYEITEKSKPKTLFSTISLKLKDGTKTDCFIVRSSIPVDIGRELTKDIHDVSRKIRDKLSNAIFQH